MRGAPRENGHVPQTPPGLESTAPIRVTPRGFQECQGTQQPPGSLAVATHHAEHGVVEALVAGWCRGRRLLQAMPGLGQAQGRQPGGHLGITIHPLPSLQLPRLKPCLSRRWMGKQTGAKCQAVIGMGYLYPFLGKSHCIQQKSLSLEIWDLHSGGRSLQRQTTLAQASLWSNHSFPVA